MDKQETFDLVVAHARKQKCRAVDEYGDCLYRGDDGTKCFVGALMPDNLYRRSFEGDGIGNVDIKAMLKKLGHDSKLCSNLQSIHDDYEVEKWEEEFRKIASAYLLRYKE